jgi:hypothetical protein
VYPVNLEKTFSNNRELRLLLFLEMAIWFSAFRTWGIQLGIWPLDYQQERPEDAYVAGDPSKYFYSRSF